MQVRRVCAMRVIASWTGTSLRSPRGTRALRAISTGFIVRSSHEFSIASLVIDVAGVLISLFALKVSVSSSSSELGLMSELISNFPKSSNEEGTSESNEFVRYGAVRGS